MIAAALDDLDKVVDAIAAVDVSALKVAEQLQVLERMETARRRQVALTHTIMNGLSKAEAPAVALKAAADVTRISLTEARKRLRDAAQLKPRTALTGEQLPAELPATAQAWQAGVLDGEHLRVIQKFLRDLPDHIAPHLVARSEEILAGFAAELRPDQLEKVAIRLVMRVNPDGKFSDEDRARQRGFVWCGGQRPDGMSVGKLIANPQLRSELDALFAKLAAPGMCNPADQSPFTSGEPPSEVSDKDSRSHAQRQHDALSALVRGQLGDPRLGQHNGLPVTVIVSTTLQELQSKATLQELQSKAGVAVTGGGTHTNRALYLGRSKRIASADQRIVLHAKERGCTAPGCDVPGYLTEVHHTDGWADGGLTNIDKLTFACSPDHARLSQGWKTRKRPDGTTEWIPPPRLGLPIRTNDFHHPERLLDSRTTFDSRTTSAD